METVWRVTLFGEMRCYRTGEETPAPVKFETEKTRRLLAYLLLHSGRSHPREVLATLLWPDSPPDKTRRRLRDALLALRTEFEMDGGPALFPGDRTTLGLAPGAFLTDAAEFAAAWKAADAADRRSDTATALTEWEKAATRYAGPLLDGVYDVLGGDDWIEPLRGHYAAGYDAALIRLSVLWAAQDRLPDALTYARKAAYNDPDDADRKAWLLELTDRQRTAEKTQFAAARPPRRSANAPAPPEAPFPSLDRPGSLSEGNFFIAPAAKAMQEGDYYKALGFYLSALAGEVTHAEQMTIAHQLQQLGFSAHFQDRGRGNISLTAFGEATRIFRANGDSRYTALCLINVADVAILLGRRAGALAAVREAYETAKNLLHPHEQGNLFVMVAETSLVMGEYELVRAALDKAIPICCAIEEPSLLAQAWRFQGEYLSDTGNFEEARRYLNDSATLFDKTDHNQQTRAAVLGLLGDVASRQAKQAEATEYYEEGLKIWEAVPHPFWMSQFKARLARVAYTCGDAPKAERLANEALTLLEGCGGQAGCALPLHVLGLLHVDWRQFAEAERCLRENLAIRRKVGTPHALAEALQGLAYGERMMGDNKQAIVHLEEAARLRQQAGTPLPPVLKTWDAAERKALGMPPLP